MKTRRRAVKDGETPMGAGAHFEASAAMVVSPATALEKYRRHVAHLNLSENAKSQLLKAVWHIMGNFVDRAFRDDPVQQAIGAVDEIVADNSSGVSGVLKSPADPIQIPNTDLPGAFQSSADGGSDKDR